MPSRVIRSSEDMASWCRYLTNLEPDGPITVSWRKGSDRSLAQNRLLWKWAGEIAEQKDDEHAHDIHAFNKLHIAIPYKRGIDEAFRSFYDEHLKPLPYEAKLAMMQPPIDLPVTRDMTVKQLSDVLDQVHAYWVHKGYQLTLPDPL